jgi:hypothetical protein
MDSFEYSFIKIFAWKLVKTVCVELESPLVSGPLRRACSSAVSQQPDEQKARFPPFPTPSPVGERTPAGKKILVNLWVNGLRKMKRNYSKLILIYSHFNIASFCLQKPK